MKSIKARAEPHKDHLTVFGEKDHNQPVISWHVFLRLCALAAKRGIREGYILGCTAGPTPNFKEAIRRIIHGEPKKKARKRK